MIKHEIRTTIRAISAKLLDGTAATAAAVREGDTEASAARLGLDCHREGLHCRNTTDAENPMKR
jgi:hypothetical protein